MGEEQKVPQAPGKEPAPEEVADKPHPMSIGLGLISPFLAGVAPIISILSLNTSERSLEVGQRAYVSLQDGRLTFGDMKVGPPPRPTVSGSESTNPDEGAEQIATKLLTVTIVNSGNTPAEFVRFTPSYDQLPGGWTVRKVEWQPKETMPPYLGAKTQSSWNYRQSFYLTPEAWSDFRQAGKRSFLYFSADLPYLDVFRKEHSVKWCWATFADEHNLGEVSNCDRLILKKVGE